MSKFNSNWIGRDTYYRKDSEVDGCPHYKQYERPEIVCLCGSTRFVEKYAEVNEWETLAGKIVLSCGCFDKSVSEEVKKQLDELHFRKIDLADSIFVVNPLVWHCREHDFWHWKFDCEQCLIENKSYSFEEPYIGESTKREIAYAKANGKTVRYLNAMEE